MSKDEKIWNLKKEIRDYQADLAYNQRNIIDIESMLSAALEELNTLESEEFKDD